MIQRFNPKAALGSALADWAHSALRESVDQAPRPSSGARIAHQCNQRGLYRWLSPAD